MTKYTRGDILEAEAEALVNTVNCVGIMGRGIALQFKKAYPDNFKHYAAACKRGEVQPGRMFVFETGQLLGPRFIINFPTKRHWEGKSRLEDIQAGLIALVGDVRSHGIRSVALPPLGSGLGGLDWSDVRPLIERAFKALPEVQVVVYEPHVKSQTSQTSRTVHVPTMTPGRAALVTLMNRYLAGLMDPTISLLEVHKLMYFLQESGEVLRLRYVEAPYGPYSENLRHVLREIEGYYVSGYADGGDAPDKQLALVPGAVRDANAFLTEHASTHDHIERVGRLVDGFETSFGLELLATVHWVATRKNAKTPDEIVRATHAWGPRKQHFSELQIGLAAERMRTEGWLPALL